MTPEVVIQRAYRDLLGREPDPQSMRNYRRRMIEENWSPGQLRQAIQESDEYQNRRVDLMIDRAYDDFLERKPDPQGREKYRKLIRQGMTEQQLRDRLRQSEEYRVILPDSKTKRAFHACWATIPTRIALKSIGNGWSMTAGPKTELRTNCAARRSIRVGKRSSEYRVASRRRGPHGGRAGAKGKV